jgi:hypothetical protein
VVDSEQDKSANERHEEAGRLVSPIVAYCATNEGPKERTGNADEHGNEDTAWIFAWHDELGNRADDKTDKSRPKQTKHCCSSVLVFPGHRLRLSCWGKHTPTVGSCKGLIEWNDAFFCLGSDAICAVAAHWGSSFKPGAIFIRSSSSFAGDDFRL